MKIWTRNYRPFIMGCDVNAPMMADVPVVGPFDLEKGYQGYLAVSPAGNTFVVESLTGGIVGDSIEEVRADISDADEEFMRQQIVTANELSKRAYMVTPEVLWKKLDDTCRRSERTATRTR